MTISVIVPAYNEEKLLGDALSWIKASLVSFHDRGWATELIVCDNNSTDQTPVLAAKAGAKVVFEPVNQIGRARNAGAKAATGDWLVFVDADSHPTPELFNDVAEAIACGRFIAGGVTLRMDSPQRWASSVVRLWNGISRFFKLLAGSFIFCEAQAFRELNGFDENLFASEEIELSKRLKRLARKRGKRIVILHAHPMLTSARKVHLYTLREHLGVVLKAFFTATRSLRDPKHCGTWYDGRR